MVSVALNDADSLVDPTLCRRPRQSDIVDVHREVQTTRTRQVAKIPTHLDQREVAKIRTRGSALRQVPLESRQLREHGCHARAAAQMGAKDVEHPLRRGIRETSLQI